MVSFLMDALPHLQGLRLKKEAVGSDSLLLGYIGFYGTFIFKELVC